MARYIEPTENQLKLRETWLASRPPNVRAVAEKFDPWSLYRLKSSGHRVTIYSFSEDKETGKVTLTVLVEGKFNYVLFERRVFGIDPNDLEECDLPDHDEILGVEMTKEEAKEYVEAKAREARQDGQEPLDS